MTETESQKTTILPENIIDYAIILILIVIVIGMLIAILYSSDPLLFKQATTGGLKKII